MKTLDDVSLLDILPEGLEVKDEARAIDPPLRAIDTDAPLIYTRIDALSSGISTTSPPSTMSRCGGTTGRTT